MPGPKIGPPGSPRHGPAGSRRPADARAFPQSARPEIPRLSRLPELALLRQPQRVSYVQSRLPRGPPRMAWNGSRNEHQQTACAVRALRAHSRDISAGSALRAVQRPTLNPRVPGSSPGRPTLSDLRKVLLPGRCHGPGVERLDPLLRRTQCTQRTTCVYAESPPRFRATGWRRVRQLSQERPDRRREWSGPCQTATGASPALNKRKTGVAGTTPVFCC